MFLSKTHLKPFFKLYRTLPTHAFVPWSFKCGLSTCSLGISWVLLEIQNFQFSLELHHSCIKSIPRGWYALCFLACKFYFNLWDALKFISLLIPAKPQRSSILSQIWWSHFFKSSFLNDVFLPYNYFLMLFLLGWR